MDESWVIERLEWWIENARAARITSFSSSSRSNETYGFTYESNSRYRALREASAQTHAIISRLLNRNNVS